VHAWTVRRVKVYYKYIFTRKLAIQMSKLAASMGVTLKYRSFSLSNLYSHMRKYCSTNGMYIVIIASTLVQGYIN